MERQYQNCKRYICVYWVGNKKCTLFIQVHFDIYHTVHQCYLIYVHIDNINNYFRVHFMYIFLLCLSWCHVWSDQIYFTQIVSRSRQWLLHVLNLLLSKLPAWLRWEQMYKIWQTYLQSSTCSPSTVCCLLFLSPKSKRYEQQQHSSFCFWELNDKQLCVLVLNLSSLNCPARFVCFFTPGLFCCSWKST